MDSSLSLTKAKVPTRKIASFKLGYLNITISKTFKTNRSKSFYKNKAHSRGGGEILIDYHTGQFFGPQK